MNNRIRSLETFIKKARIRQDSKVVVFTGAGMSAESGLNTFRDNGGLWEDHRIEEVASIDAWHDNPSKVLEFYNKRRRQLLKVAPNLGHLAIAKLQGYFPYISVITQNVDDLHERAGQKRVLHLHGELKLIRSTGPSESVFSLTGSELIQGDLCPEGFQLRPHIVWFGEMVPAFDEAALMVEACDLLIVVGTSLAVYPAANLLNYIREGVEILLIDPEEPSFNAKTSIYYYPLKAAQGLEQLAEVLMSGGINEFH
jgi:NAD-dependent deacetylase